LWVGYPPFSTGNHKKSHLFRLQDRQLLEKTHGMIFWAWIGTPKGISFKDNHGQPKKHLLKAGNGKTLIKTIPFFCETNGVWIHAKPI